MTERLDLTVAAVRPADAVAGAAARAALDAKTKPRGSLGRLEALACRIAAIRGEARPGRLRSAIVVAAADHGVAEEGVSAYPQDVTGQMLATIAAGGAAVSVLAREAGARLVVVDVGVREASQNEGVLQRRVRAGTANATLGPAMSVSEVEEAVAVGIELAAELAGDGIGLVALGEMGIANTTAASALTAAVLGAEPAAVCGRGTGVDDAGLARKVATVRRALEANGLAAEQRSARVAAGAREWPAGGAEPLGAASAERPAGGADPLRALASVGGLEIAALAGVALGCAARRVPVLLDGFITGAAALAAVRLAEPCADSLIAAHRSPEPGHALILDALGLDPLLDLDLRLGEGSGAALALPLVDAALAILSDMATFDAAGVTDTGA